LQEQSKQKKVECCLLG